PRLWRTQLTYQQHAKEVAVIDQETPGQGHNSGVAADQLRSIVERIERLEEEKAVIANDIKEVYAEAKGNGFDTKTLRKIIRLRKIGKAERQEAAAMLELFAHALDMEDFFS